MGYRRKGKGRKRPRAMRRKQKSKRIKNYYGSRGGIRL